MTDKDREYQREYWKHRYEYYKPIYDEFIKLYPFGLENLPGEVWKVIPNFTDYHCSNFGRVKSLKTEKILKPLLLRNGYLRVCLCKKGKEHYLSTHQLVAICFLPNPENLPEINHEDGNKFNNYVENLTWSTGSDNVQHALRTGLRLSGTDHGQAKLTAAQVLYIRENPDGLTGRELAAKFDIHDSVISDIQLGKTYKNVGGKIRQSYLPCNPHQVPDDRRNQIREKFLTGNYNYKQLAEMFNISERTVGRIIHEK